eukprot:XP_014771592.1 PREDICTED: transmembrane protein 209-like [Octopus bimaculoides]
MVRTAATHFINAVLRKQKLWRYSQNSLFWAAFNLLLAFILYIDIRYFAIQQYFEVSYPNLWYAESVFFLLFCLNTLVDLVCWMWPYIMSSQIELTPKQKTLLGVNDTDPGFKISPLKPNVSSSTPTKLMFNCSGSSQPHSYSSSHTPPGAGSSIYYTPGSGSKSSHSPPGSSPRYHSPMSSTYSSHTPNVSSGSLHYSYSSNHSSPTYWSSDSAVSALLFDFFFVFFCFCHWNVSKLEHLLEGVRLINLVIFKNTMDRPNNFKFWHKASNFKRAGDNNPFEQITDLKALSQYLREEEQKESRSQLSSPETLSSSSTSFWNYGRSASDNTCVLRKYQYQVATRTPQSSTTTRDTTQDVFSYTGNEVWNRFSVSEANLYLWTERIRKWVALTIVAKLAKEIPSINNCLKRIGSEDNLIGEVSIANLKQVVLTKGALVPTLNSVIPFLDLTSNQEYLVKRIYELGKDGCMSEFCWNQGGHYGKEWGEHLPNDASLVMHLFCTYMDSRLPVHPKFPDQRTFSSQYFMKTPNKPDLTKKSNFYIYQTNINPPHFQVTIGEHVYNLPKGRNNMFHALLLFLYHIKAKEHGMLGRVNLGLSGVNIMWIFN